MTSKKLKRVLFLIWLVGVAPSGAMLAVRIIWPAASTPDLARLAPDQVKEITNWFFATALPTLITLGTALLSDLKQGDKPTAADTSVIDSFYAGLLVVVSIVYVLSLTGLVAAFQLQSPLEQHPVAMFTSASPFFSAAQAGINGFVLVLVGTAGPRESAAAAATPAGV
jgi:hypothetical protein